MALILSIQDKTDTIYEQAFMTATVEVGNESTVISLRFWKDFQAYKNNAELLFNNAPLTFQFPNTLKLFKDNFATDKLIPQGKTLLINLYDNILKNMNGTEEAITFYNDEIGINNEFEPRYIEFKFQALLGFDFTSATDSFSQSEIDLKINGLQNISNGHIIFNETTEKYQAYSLATDSWEDVE